MNGRALRDETLHPLLVVEDDVHMARTLARVLQRFGPPRVAHSIRDAESALDEDPRRVWRAFFIDVGLPDGCGLDFLAHARAAHPSTPAMVLTGGTEPATINRAYDLEADYVVKPLAAQRIQRFMSSPSPKHARRLARVTSAWSARYRLTHGETDVLVRAVNGERREAIALSRGSSALTVKTQVFNLLKKTGDDSLNDAVKRVLREA